MSDIFLLSALLLLPLIVFVLRRGTQSSDRQLLPPCPPKLPLLGNLHQLSSLPHQSLHALSKKHGPLMLLKLGQVPTLVASSAAAAKEIMRTHDHIFASRPSLKGARFILYGARDVAFSPYGESWRQMRKICVNHLLNTKIVNSLRAVHEEEVASMVSKISEMSTSSSGVVDMSEVLNSFMSKLVCSVLFGDYFQEEVRFRHIFKLIEELVGVIGYLSIGDCIPWLGWLDKFSGFETRATMNFKEWDALLEEVIIEHEKRSELKEEDKTNFTYVLLAQQKNKDREFSLSRVAVKAILMDMIAAGIDTSFLVLDWGFAELIRNPQAMKKLQDEVRNISGTSESVITAEDLSKMHYLKAVIKEVMRLHPPAPLLVPRESMDHCKIGGYEIPKQTRVFVNVWAIGRDPDFWEAPDEFRPERFLGSSIDYKGHDFEFTPFGAGRRICPGMQFATSTLELAFAHLIKSFDWELPDGMRRGDLDMGESPGLTARRRQSLHLIARPLKA